MADKYDLPPYALSRVRYYDGEFLKDDEFIEEQKYHIDRRRRHDRLLHVAGVCEGLAPALGGDSKTIKVAPGTAIDDLGHQILVGAERTIAVKPEMNGALWIELLFQEKEDRLADENSAVTAATRFTEEPLLQLSAASSAHAVVLGQATISNGDVVEVKTAGRVYSGLRLPGPEGGSYSLRNQGEAAPGWVELDAALSVKGSLKVAGNIDVDPAHVLSFGKQVRQMVNLWSTSYGLGVQGSTIYLRTGKNVAFYKGGTHSASELDAGGGTAMMVINDGNVGIGTSAPTAGNKLHVAGNAIFDGNIFLRSPDDNIYSLELVRTDEEKREHKWALWHMNRKYRKNAFEIWEYKTDSHGKSCGGDTADGAICTPRLVILEGGNIGIGTTGPSAKLSVVAEGANQLAGTVRSKALTVSAGTLDKEAGTEVVLASLGFHGGNNSFLGIRAHRNVNGEDWHSTAIGLGMDVDNTVRAGGASLWLSSTGGVGVGTSTPTAGNKLHVAGNAIFDGNIFLRSPDENIYSLELVRTDEEKREHKWALWHMNGEYRKNAFEIWEYRTDSHGKSCGGDTADGAICTPRLVILEGGNVGIGTTAPAAQLSVVAEGANQLAGTVRSKALTVSAGTLGNQEGAEVVLASLGFHSGNNSFLGIRACRTANSNGWSTTAIGLGMDVDNTVRAGASLWLAGNGRVGIGTTAPAMKLTVSSSSLNLQLRREKTETTGGKQLFLELYQDDPEKKVPTVYPSIRFHHANKYLHRVEGREDGFHFKNGALANDSYVKIYAGAASFAGKVGIGTTELAAQLNVVAEGASQLHGTVRSKALMVCAGKLDKEAGTEVVLASLGFHGGNNSFLGIRAHRNVNGEDWHSTAIGLGMDVDNTVRAGGASLWLSSTGGVGVGTSTPTAGNKLHVAGNAIFDGNIFLRSPDDNIYSLELVRTDEGKREHKWALWHMNGKYRKNAFEIWEYKTDSHGKSCGGDTADGAMCTPRLVILEGGDVCIGTTDSAGHKLRVAGSVLVDGLLRATGLSQHHDDNGGVGAKTWHQLVLGDNGTWNGNYNRLYLRRDDGTYKNEIKVKYADGTGSSRAAKTDISPVPEEMCASFLEEIMATQLVHYRLSNPPDREEDLVHLGIIAEDAPAEIVDARRTGLEIGDYCAFLLAGIKALKREVDALRGELTRRDRSAG